MNVHITMFLQGNEHWRSRDAVADVTSGFSVVDRANRDS